MTLKAVGSDLDRRNFMILGAEGLVGFLVGCEDALRGAYSRSETGRDAGNDGSITFPEISEIRSAAEEPLVPREEPTTPYTCPSELGRPDISCDPDAGTRRYLPGEQSRSLASYPGCFVNADGSFNGYFVIGSNALSTDNLSVTDIATGMRYFNNEALVPVYTFPDVKLDSEIEDIQAQNLIVVGPPCKNTVSAELSGNPADCTDCLEPGEGRIRLFQHTNGYSAMLVDGYSAADTRLAAKVIANRTDELCGLELRVTGTTWEDAVIEVMR